MDKMDQQNPFLKYVDSNNQDNPIANDKNNPFAKYVQPQTPIPMEDQQQKPGAFWDALAVMNRNFAAVANGSLQTIAQGLGALGMDTSEFQAKIANLQAAHDYAAKQAMQNSPITGNIMNVASSIGAAISAPGAQPFIAQSLGANLGERIIGAGAASAISSGEQYVPDGTLDSRIKNTVEGALLGTAFQGAGEALGYGINKGTQALFTNNLDDAAKIATDTTISPTVGTVTGTQGIQRAESALANVPYLGTKRAMNKVASQVTNVVSNTLDELGVGTKTKVDVGNALASNIDEAKKLGTINTDKAYTKALNIADQQGLSVPLSNTQNLANKAIGEIGDLGKFLPSSSTVGTPAGKLLSDIANIPEGAIPAKLFDTLRKKVGTTISSLAKGADDDGLLPVFNKIKDSLDTDLDALGNAASNSEFGNALKTARQTYIEQKLPFQEIDVLAKSTNGTLDVDQLLDKIVQSDRPILTSKIMKQLSPEGKQVFTTAIVQKAFKNAINTTGDNVGELNLAKFNSNLYKLGETLDALPKAEQLKFKGLQKLMTRADYIIRAANKSPGSLTNTLTGYGILGYMAQSIGAFPTFLGTAAGTKFISKALTSPSVARGLVRLAGGKLGTTATDGVVTNLLKKIIDPDMIASAQQSLGNIANSAGVQATKQAAKAAVIPAAATSITD